MRSSAPYYPSEDEEQRMDEEAIRFLIDNGIDTIISANGRGLENQDDTIARLTNNGITYIHIPLVDFTAPTLNNFQRAYNAFSASTRTLVYCGAGIGRTGTFICAILMYDPGTADKPLTEKDYEDRGVETPEQTNALNALKANLGLYIQQTFSSDAYRYR